MKIFVNRLSGFTAVIVEDESFAEAELITVGHCMKKSWFAYIVLCSDSTFYTGITNDLQRRIEEHNSGEKGAKYTRSRRPVRLVYQEVFTCRADAAKRESAIKSMRREDKRALLAG